MKCRNSTLFDIIKIWYMGWYWFPTLKNVYRSPFSKWPPQYCTNSSLSDFNDISWQTFWKCRITPLIVTYHYVKFYVSIIIDLEVININVRNFNFPIGLSFQLCGIGGQSHILRASKGVGVTIESYGKVEISYINVDNF
jgi:hypothetical protein